MRLEASFFDEEMRIGLKNVMVHRKTPLKNVITHDKIPLKNVITYEAPAMRRKIMDELIKWKNSPHDKALVVKGLRQVGKTYIINEFCHENYDHVVYINFKEQK